MKELSIEEKAKRYDDASKWMGGIYPTLTHEQQWEAEAFFPELKESEDEKTKRLLHTIADKMSQHLRDIFTEEEFQCFDAWLEKHGSQNLANSAKTCKDGIGSNL